MAAGIAVPTERSRGRRAAFFQHHRSRTALRAKYGVILFFFGLVLLAWLHFLFDDLIPPLMTTCIAVPMERSRGKRVSFVQHHCSRAALRAMDFVILFFFRLFLVIVNRGWIQRSQGAFHIVCPDLQTKERWNPGCSQGLHDMSGFLSAPRPTDGHKVFIWWPGVPRPQRRLQPEPSSNAFLGENGLQRLAEDFREIVGILRDSAKLTFGHVLIIFL